MCPSECSTRVGFSATLRGAVGAVFEAAVKHRSLNGRGSETVHSLSLLCAPNLTQRLLQRLLVRHNEMPWTLPARSRGRSGNSRPETRARNRNWWKQDTRNCGGSQALSQNENAPDTRCKPRLLVIEAYVQLVGRMVRTGRIARTSSQWRRN